MDKAIDWTLTTFEGSRRRQHQEFLALSFREKLQAMEDMAEVARAWGMGTEAGATRVREDAGSRKPGQSDRDA